MKTRLIIELEKYIDSKKIKDPIDTEIFKVKDNSYTLDARLRQGCTPGGRRGKISPDFAIIGDVYIPITNNSLVIIDTAIKDISTGEIFYVNKKISLIEKDKYRDRSMTFSDSIFGY